MALKIVDLDVPDDVLRRVEQEVAVMAGCRCPQLPELYSCTTAEQFLL